MKSVALITCSNGFGHIRRVLLLAKALADRQLKVVIFGPLSSINIFDKENDLPAIEIVDFNTQTNAENWINGSAENWYKDLPDLSRFDIVVSDNLIEVLRVRHDAWLSGSFFWHESLEYFPKKLKNKSKELLLKHKPRMISSALFASKYLKTYTDLHEVGIFTDSDSAQSLTANQSKNDVLISCGKGGDIVTHAKNFITWLSQEKEVIFDTVWVEPSLFPKKPPHWMKKATFTKQMYQALVASVIRPGVGTVTDSLLAKSMVFLYYELDNFEMRENAASIDAVGLGVDSFLITDAWHSALDYMDNSESQQRFNQKASALNINGTREATEILVSSLEN